MVETGYAATYSCLSGRSAQRRTAQKILHLECERDCYVWSYKKVQLCYIPFMHPGHRSIDFIAFCWCTSSTRRSFKAEDFFDFLSMEASVIKRMVESSIAELAYSPPRCILPASFRTLHEALLHSISDCPPLLCLRIFSYFLHICVIVRTGIFHRSDK